jgi:hypothetical protein
MEGDMFGAGESLAPEVVEVAQEPIEAFAEQPSEPAPAAEIPPGTVTIPEPKAEPGFVPLAAVLDERDRRKQLERELEQYRQQQAAPKPEVIDPWTDLDGALAQRDQQVQLMLHQQKVQMSRRFAEIQHGKEPVDEALKWAHSRCDADPAFNQQVFAADDPIGFAVAQYQRDQIASTVTMDDFKAFQAWKQAQSNPQSAAQIPAPLASSAAPPPPRSLVSAQSAGAPSMPKNDPAEERLGRMF